jgi:ubiquinone/menaquinone biosynthesis C-methylase UbiE
MLRNFIASQFKKPRGLVGIWSSNVMIKGNQKNYDKLIKSLDPKPNDKLLEIGYGPGRGIHNIAKAFPACTIHGIDFSPLMYKRAHKHNKSFIEKGNVHLQHGDFLHVATSDKDYDKVFCLNVVYFWNDLHKPFTKVCSLLKKGGSFHIYMADRGTLLKMKTPDTIFNKYSIRQVVDELLNAGFDNIESSTENGHYIHAKK